MLVSTNGRESEQVIHNSFSSSLTDSADDDGQFTLVSNTVVRLKIFETSNRSSNCDVICLHSHVIVTLINAVQYYVFVVYCKHARVSIWLTYNKNISNAYQLT